ncbi:MAG: outer membrane beta-barrel protein [Flavobacteriales bacterium]|nr:outer membrane beta-barrel protein [Flavobacteriales bacterium]MCB9447736.1 outer membrane beta-barrel protein [Flavobacteriales bacterium]
MKKHIYSSALLALLTLASIQVSAQEEEEMQHVGPDMRISAGITFGSLSYFGDIGYGTHNDLVSFATERRMFGLIGQKRLTDYIGVSGNLLFGRISKSERSNQPSRNKNFLSNIIQLDGQLMLHSDNDLTLAYDIEMAPYLAAGVGFMYFNSKTDLKAGNTDYYYWTNGKIMNRAENAPDAINAKEMNRDYVYETKLDSSHAAFTFPLTLGVTFKLHENVQADIKGSLYFTTTDYLDGYDNGVTGGVDMFSMVGVSVRYFLPEF